MAVDNSRKKTTPPRPNLPPEGQPWGRWVTDTLNELKLDTGGVKREVISSNKNHNAQLQMSAQQKREIVKVNLKAEEALNIALAASGSTTIYFVAPETPEQGDIWYENATGIWFRWVDDQWVPITDETLLEALEAILAQRIANDDKIRTFAQQDAPTGMTAEHVGDLWYDTDDKNKLYRWDGIQWVPIRDAGITEAQETADDAKETADNAAGVVSQLEAQVTADLGAMQGRLVTAEGELTDLENVTLPALNSNLAALGTALTDLQNDVDNLVIPSGDGLNTITYSTAAPSATAGYKEGDTWFRYTGTGASRVIYGQWHFTGSAWNEVALRNEMIASLDAGKITTGFLDADRVAANSIEGKHIKGGSITASDAIFANAAIQAADISSINADTITVGTLRGIDIEGVTIHGTNVIEAGGGRFTVNWNGHPVFDVDGGSVKFGSDHPQETFGWLNTTKYDHDPEGEVTIAAAIANETAYHSVATLHLNPMRWWNNLPTRKRFNVSAPDAHFQHGYFDTVFVGDGNGIVFPPSGTDVGFGYVSADPWGPSDTPHIGHVGNGSGQIKGFNFIRLNGGVVYDHDQDKMSVRDIEAARDLTVHGKATINGSPIPRMATGSVYTGGSPDAGANQTHNISFPPGRFTSVPLVQVTSVNTYGRALVSVDSITTSGARVVTQRVGSSWGAGELHWFATQN